MCFRFIVPGVTKRDNTFAFVGACLRELPRSGLRPADDVINFHWHKIKTSTLYIVKIVAVFLWVIVYPERVLGGIKDAVNGDGIVWGKFVEDDVGEFTDYPVADIIVHKRPASRHFFELGKCLC